ncbi:hypothetical protein ARMGADRAFT_1075655 [Armillaria gallica]|uniref:Uncharacterized protein n=1 Tax=Armillaria gallica TaxID=47427 RepID=A0A2H3DUF5_ARMGA|nr:hypothetical protein ARMGADRAFT_1075655 [Armillaria gallica]
MSKCARGWSQQKVHTIPGHISVPLLNLLSSSALPLPRLHPPRPPSCACSQDKATSQVGVFSLASGILGRGEGEGTRACSSDEDTPSRHKIRVSSLAAGILVRGVDGVDGFKG